MIMGRKMIEISDMHFHYPGSDFRLRIDELKLAGGASTAVIGPSGFGKTTLLNLMAGILLPDSGDIRVGERLVNQMNETERRNFRIRDIGFVFQDFRLIPYLNVLDNVLLPFRINSILKMDDEKEGAAVQLAGELGLENKLKKYPAKLSHGERQRVAICRALVNNPPIILADEPTGNLDPQNKHRIMRILFEYVRNNSATLIAVTHDQHMLEGFSDTIDFKDFQEN